ALEEGPKGLAADHASARYLADRLQQMKGVSVFPVETNIVIFDVSETGRAPRDISSALKERGVLLNGVNERLMRAVTHRDVSREQCAAAMDALLEVL
ncbi:MAG TPA: hypothetical protein VHB50_00875, partial [Bryobacteraceae bacterium]|nr:hypothetical protein [Bryobacteraceae bacterium]